MNDPSRSYGNFDVGGGRFSIFFRDGGAERQHDRYVKPLFHECGV
jgi:hypothetical protein